MLRAPSRFVAVLALAAACSDAGPATPAAPDDSAAGADASALTAPWPVTLESAPEHAPSFERIVLMTIDTLRVDHVSAYGYPRRTTPFLDRLAREGVLFEDASSAAGLTVPSHATMLTGLPPAVHGILRNGLVLAQPNVTAATLLREAGFETAAFLNVGFLQGITGDFEHVTVERGQGQLVVSQAIEWLETRGREAPSFFLWVHVYDPHRWTSPADTPPSELADVRALDSPRGDKLFEYIADLHGFSSTDPPRWLSPADFSPDLPEPERTDRKDVASPWNDAYDAQILRADRGLRRLYGAVEALEAERGSASTLWIVTSDHGEGLGSHGYAGHARFVYQEQLHVPLVVHATDGRFGRRRVRAPVRHVDLMPTLAELVGARLSSPAGLLEGSSLVPWLEGATPPGGEHESFAQRGLGVEGEGDMYALRAGRHKLVRHASGLEELFDLEADPREANDVTGEAAERARAMSDELARRLALYHAHTQDAADPADPDVDEAWLDELRAMGYVGDE